MKTTVVSSDYVKLQEAILKKQEQWKSGLGLDALELHLDSIAIEGGVPFVAQTNFHLDFPLFLQWVHELRELLVDSREDLEAQMTRVIDLLDQGTAYSWMEEAFAFNEVYFLNFAKEHGTEEWIPQFVAETLYRPYLQLLAQKLQNKMTHSVPGCGCPVCGEPVRLGQLEGKGQKVLYCPRCQADWHEKKLACSHCGNDNSETIKFITVEGRPTEQIHVCEQCKGYTKIIDTRQYIEKPAAQLLDLKTIHLDYIAQENGYLVMGEKKIKE